MLSHKEFVGVVAAVVAAVVYSYAHVATLGAKIDGVSTKIDTKIDGIKSELGGKIDVKIDGIKSELGGKIDSIISKDSLQVHSRLGRLEGMMSNTSEFKS